MGIPGIPGFRVFREFRVFQFVVTYKLPFLTGQFWSNSGSCSGLVWRSGLVCVSYLCGMCAMCAMCMLCLV